MHPLPQNYHISHGYMGRWLVLGGQPRAHPRGAVTTAAVRRSVPSELWHRWLADRMSEHPGCKMLGVGY